MKKILFTVLLFTIACINVYADNHDVNAKYEKTYNVELSSIILNNDTQSMKLGTYLLEFSTNQKNIEVIVIKVESNENDYVKSFTNNDENYYIGFFKDGKKTTTNNIKVKVKNKNKVLSIFDNLGNIIDTTNENINLKSNNYFMTITNEIENNNNNYLLVDINSFIEDLENIELNEDATIKVYNSKNELIDPAKKLGTGYRIVIDVLGVTDEYKIVAKGDITGDAQINLNDITRLYHYYKKIEQMDNVFILAGDVANNDIINLNDITKLYHYYKGLIEEL